MSSEACVVPNLTELDPGKQFPRISRFIVEIPKNSKNKYEFDTELGLFRLDRPLYSPFYYPGDYGFIPGTKSEDGDPLDVLALVQHECFSGCLYEIRPVGVLDMIDQGKPDRKILGVPRKDPRYAEIRRVTDIAAHTRLEIEHFFAEYKELEGKKTHIRGWKSHLEAQRLMLAARRHYLEDRAPSGASGISGTPSPASRLTRRRAPGRR